MFQSEPDLGKAVEPGTSKKVNTEEEYQMARQQFRLFQRAYDAGHDDYLDLKEKCNSFYIGDQWDARTLRKLEAEGKPALTINMILSTVNVVLGEQIGRRVDIQFKPRRNASQEAATALSKLTLSILEANQFQWKESLAFADGLIEERGYFDIRMNFDENIYGDAKIDTVDPAEILPDPDARSYDPTEWREFYRYYWLSLDEVEETYGVKHRRRLENSINLEHTFGKDSIRRVRTTFGDTDINYATQFSRYDDDETHNFVTKVRIIERQFYKPVKVYSLVDPVSGDDRELPMGVTKAEAQALADKYEAFLHRKTKNKVRWRITSDQFVLHDDWSPYRTFTIVPYFAYFRRGKPFGMVRNLISPQEQFNKLSSQELHIVNTTANSGYIVEKGTLHGMTTDDLRAQGSSSGLVIEVNPGKMAGIDKIKPNTVPTGIDRLSLKAQENVKAISGITNAMLGDESAEISGVALKSMERRGQVQIQVPIDNLSRTRHMVGRKLLELIQDYYTDERIIYTTAEAEPGQPTETMVINEIQETGETKNNVIKGSYDLVIATLPARDNFRDSQFAEAINLRQAGIQIPDHHVIKYSNLAHKEDVAAEVRNLAGLGEKTPEQIQEAQEMAEMQKRGMAAEVQDKEAQAQERMSQAELNKAKVEDMERDDMRQLRQMEFDNAMDLRTAGLRVELQQMAGQSKVQNTLIANAAKEGNTNEQERQQ